MFSLGSLQSLHISSVSFPCYVKLLLINFTSRQWAVTIGYKYLLILECLRVKTISVIIQLHFSDQQNKATRYWLDSFLRWQMKRNRMIILTSTFCWLKYYIGLAWWKISILILFLRRVLMFYMDIPTNYLRRDLFPFPPGVETMRPQPQNWYCNLLSIAT